MKLDFDCRTDPAYTPWAPAPTPRAFAPEHPTSPTIPTEGPGVRETAPEAARRMGVPTDWLREGARNRGIQLWGVRGRPPKSARPDLPSSVWDRIATERRANAARRAA